MLTPLIINLAPTGMVPTRAQNPAVPVSPQQIIDDVIACYHLGVSMAHIHVRSQDEQPSHDRDLYAQVFSVLRQQLPDLILVGTTSGRNTQNLEQRASSLLLEAELRPDMASLTLGSLNFANSASVNSPKDIIALAEIMQRQGIKPELEVFDMGMLNFAKHLIKLQLIEPPYYFNILLGNIAGAQASSMELACLIAALPEQSICSIAGLGRQQFKANCFGMLEADGIRIGLEDNLWMDDARQELATNAGLVQRFCELSRLYGRPISTAQMTRDRLNLKKVRT